MTIEVIPLGGLGEIGKNSTIIRYEDDLVLVDAGLAFASDDLPGVDYIVPSAQYLVEHQHQLRGILLTHGHEDHIGGLPYLLRQLNGPVRLFGSKLTLALVEHKLREAKLLEKAELVAVESREELQLGELEVEFIRMSHSIPGCLAIAIHTPMGVVVHTGDFKLDPTPVDGEVTDYFTLARLGEDGVLLLMSDSTNVGRPGVTPSEKEVGAPIMEAVRRAHGRIIVTTFASNVHRVQQVLDIAHEHGRKVALAGRSMENVVRIAREQGYLKVPSDLIVRLSDLDQFPPNEQLIVCTGSQGEPMSALTRMARGEYRHVKIQMNDTVLISAIPIPGNERAVAKTINNLFGLGAQVVYESHRGMHVSGHASQEELKWLINLVRPRSFMPVHGENRHLLRHAELATNLGVRPDQILVAANGDRVEVTEEGLSVVGQVDATPLMIDGDGIGHVAGSVVMERQRLGREGILVMMLTVDSKLKPVVGPKVLSKGFMPEGEAADLHYEVEDKLLRELETLQKDTPVALDVLQQKLLSALGRFLQEKVGRRPMLIPMIQQVAL